MGNKKTKTKQKQRKNEKNELPKHKKQNIRLWVFGAYWTLSNSYSFSGIIIKNLSKPHIHIKKSEINFLKRKGLALEKEGIKVSKVARLSYQ